VTPVVRLSTGQLPPAVVSELRSLLWAAFSDGLSEEDFEHCLGGEHVMVRDGDALVAHAAVIPRTLYVDTRPVRAGYVEGVATLPSRQGERFGSRTMRLIGTAIRERYEMGALSTGRHSFYRRLGWERWRGPSWVILDGERVRTVEDDDGLMVLRFGPSADLDLTSPITCHDRPGDAW
jgi:aminoglycoside 2'-N-acetyltransferase I